MTRPPLSHEQHSRLKDAKLFLNGAIAALDERADLVTKLGYVEFMMRRALYELSDIECGVGRTVDFPVSDSPPSSLRLIPRVGGSPGTGPKEAA